MRNVNGSKNVLGYFAAGVFALAFTGTPVALAQSSAGQPAKVEAKDKENKQHKAQSKGTKVGDKAPDFTLTDTDGKEHKLSSSSGKIVVIEWFNPDCPFVKKHHETNKTFNNLHTKYGEKVQFFAINSGSAGAQGAGQERNAKAKTDFALPYPILLDESGEVGKAYGSRNTPAMYIIAADGTLAYFGAVDDDATQNLGKTNYISKALDEMLANKPVSTKETKPYGCSVKYAK